MPDKNAAEDAGKPLNEYYTRYTELAEKWLTKQPRKKYQKDFWGLLRLIIPRMLNCHGLVQEDGRLLQECMDTTNFETQQERTKRLTELYQETMKTVYDNEYDQTPRSSRIYELRE